MDPPECTIPIDRRFKPVNKVAVTSSATASDPLCGVWCVLSGRGASGAGRLHSPADGHGCALLASPVPAALSLHRLHCPLLPAKETHK